MKAPLLIYLRPLRVRLMPLLLATVCAAAPLSGQTYKPAKILFPGSPDDQAAALVALSGLTPGKPITSADIDKALQLVGDTGLFIDLRYTVDDRALTFTLTPTPPAQMLPAIYSNFLFWKPAELTPLVHARVPLFTGKVPTSGTLQQSVADALTAILLEKGIKGSVEFVLSGRGGGIAYAIANPAVQIRQVHAEAVSPLADAKVTGMLHNFDNSPYDVLSAEAIHQRLVETYLDLGFLDIAVDNAVRTEPVVEPTRISVDFSTTVHENGQYLIAKLEWPATPIVPPADFAHDIPLKAGDPASRIELLAAAARAQSEFERHGYLDAKLTRAEQKNDAAHTIAYTFTAEPGELYHVKSVHVAGFSDEQQKDFDRFWKLAPGAPYDGSYASTFFSRNSNVQSFRSLKPELHLNPNHADHTVELIITASPGPAAH